MTKQEYYDLLVKTSEEGGFPAIDANSYCKYRAPDGRKCAVGLIIPDKQYTPEFERRVLLRLIDDGYVDMPEGMSADDMYKVQRIHDSIASRDQEWKHNAFVERLNNLDWCRNLQLAKGL